MHIRYNFRRTMSRIFLLIFAYIFYGFSATAQSTSALDIEYERVISTGYKPIENFPLLKSLAERGHLKSQFTTAENYYWGTGGVKSYAEAIKWYKKAAKQDHGFSMYKLAEMHENGKGFSKSSAMAAKWYEKSADLGHGEAMYKFGGHYYRGDGVVQSYKQAAYWFKKSANANNAVGKMLIKDMEKNKPDAVRNMSRYGDQKGTSSVSSSSNAMPQSQPSLKGNPTLARALKTPDQGSIGYDKCTATTPSYNVKTLLVLCDNSAAIYELMAEITDPPITPMQKDVYYLKAGHAFTISMKYRFISAAPKKLTCDTRDRALELFAKSKQSPPKGSAVGNAYKEAASQIFIGMCRAPK